MITKEKRSEIIKKHQAHPKDTGTPAVQVALLTERIKMVSEHMKENPKDYASQLGLLKQVGYRRRLLAFLKKNEPATYEKTLKQLDLRK